MTSYGISSGCLIASVRYKTHLVNTFGLILHLIFDFPISNIEIISKALLRIRLRFFLDIFHCKRPMNLKS